MARSLPVLTSHQVNGASQTKRDSSSPTVMGFANGDDAATQVHQESAGEFTQAGLMPTPLLSRNSSSPDLGLEKRIMGHNRPTRKVINEELPPPTLNVAFPTQMEESGLQYVRPGQEGNTYVKSTSHMMNRDGYNNITAGSTRLPSTNTLLTSAHQVTGDTILSMQATSADKSIANGYIQALQHKQLSFRKGLESNNSELEIIGSKQDLQQDGLKLQNRLLNTTSNNSPLEIQVFNKTANIAQLDPPVLSQSKMLASSGSIVQPQPEINGRSYKGNGISWDAKKLVVQERHMPNLSGNNLVTFDHASPSSQPVQIYHPPNIYQSDTMKMISHDLMGPGAITVPLPAAHKSHASDANAYVNVTESVPGSSSNLEMPRARLNSDKLCPVCSKDYSHVSMEDFQTHVFECFDDENSPETMKPHESSDRTCPMCNITFGSTTTQTDYEKHVHGHFGERPGDNFEILQWQ